MHTITRGIHRYTRLSQWYGRRFVELGADLNVRNNDCETPIFMTVDTFCGPMVRGLNEGTFTSRMLFIHVMEGPRHDRQRHRRIHSSKGF